MKKYLIALGICLLAVPTMAADGDVFGETPVKWVRNERVQPNFGKAQELVSQYKLTKSTVSDAQAVQLCETQWGSVARNLINMIDPEGSENEDNDNQTQDETGLYKQLKLQYESLENALKLAGMKKGQNPY